MSPQHASANMQQQMALLQRSYLQRLPQQLQRLESAWQALTHNNFDDTARHTLSSTLQQLIDPKLYTALHPTAEQALRQLQQTLQQFLQGEPITQREVTQNLQLLSRLSSVIEPDQSQPVANTPTTATRSNATLLLAVTRELTGQLTPLLQQLGYQLQFWQESHSLEQQLKQGHADLLLIDASQQQRLQPHQKNRGLRTRLPLPTLLIAAENGLEGELEALRQGYSGKIVLPLDHDQLQQELAALTGHQNAPPYRVLIVEDADEQALFYRRTLESFGFKTNHCNNPLQIERHLVEFDPELLLLDFYMPHCNGYELAQLIRHQPRYRHLPIVFLSSEDSVTLQLEAVKLGGNDFLSKPVRPRQLFSTLCRQIENHRQLNQNSRRDLLTQVLNSEPFKQRLSDEFQRAFRYNELLSLLVVDIDHFSEINQQYGFACGDRVLQRLAKLLRQRLRSSDIIARTGGGRFTVILPESDSEVAQMLCEEIRQQFASITFQGRQQSFCTSFSAGHSDNQLSCSAQQLLQSAEAALSSAKSQGRNQLVSQ